MACPRCGGPTGPWSGYRRHLRDALELHRIFVPRVRCRACGVTAALLPWFVTPYRWDTVDVIGRALELSIGGQGVRAIAAALGRPETTVREWTRRFGRTADALARVLLAAAVRSAWSGFELPVTPGSRCLAAADALASAWARRHGPAGPWRVASLVSLAPQVDASEEVAAAVHEHAVAHRPAMLTSLADADALLAARIADGGVGGLPWAEQEFHATRVGHRPQIPRYRDIHQRNRLRFLHRPRICAKGRRDRRTEADL